MSAEGTPEQKGELTVHALAERFGAAPPETLRRALGEGFLVVRGNPRPDERPVGARFATVVAERERLTDEPAVSGAQLVIALPSQGKPPLAPWIGVGRLSRNTVVVADPSVSKLHALIRHVGGRYQIADAGSKNGTYVNGAAAPRYDRGEPPTLNVGDSIRLGAVGLLFLGAEELSRLVESWAASAKPQRAKGR